MSLYDSFIERDLAAIPAAVRQFRHDHSSNELWQSVTRFSILAYAPSQHSKHALFSCLAAWDLRALLGDRFDEVVTQCAIYTAASRQPWSEPPFLDPPAVSAGAPRDREELRQSVATGDRRRAERWLAARFEDPEFAADLFAVAAEDCEDLGHKLIAAVTATRLAALLGEKGRFAALRVAVWEMVAYRRHAAVAPQSVCDAGALAAVLATQMIAARGEVEAAHRLFLLDAALLTEDREVLALVCGALAEAAANAPETVSSRDETPAGNQGELPVYALARDYGELLKTWAVAGRMAQRFPSIDAAAVIAAARDHLEQAPSSDEFTFA